MSTFWWKIRKWPRAKEKVAPRDTPHLPDRTMIASERFIISDTAIRDIVSRARPLWEYFDNTSFATDTTDPQILNAECFARWCQVVADGNPVKFHQRLQLLRFSIGASRATQYAADNHALPVWAMVLKQVISASLCLDGTCPSIAHFPTPLNPDAPLPFEDILLPACFVARERLMASLGCISVCPQRLILELLCEQSYLALEQSLLMTLVRLCENVLEDEFSSFRPLGVTVLSLILKEKEVTSDTTYYKAFVSHLLRDGLLKFFQKYPVLGRLLATRIEFWVQTIFEFLQRLKQDRADIRQYFLNTLAPTVDRPGVSSLDELGQVIAIEPRLSDYHNGGRCVISVTFKLGLKLVYKPRDVGVEVAYNQLLEWFNRNNPPLSFKWPKVLNRHTYGWVEYIEHRACEDESAVCRFYQRAGMLLCLLYILRATDCHYENVIASGDQLIVIDTETLMHPEYKGTEGMSQNMSHMTTMIDPYEASVLLTGLLPVENANDNKEITYDVSGLGCVNSQPLPWRMVLWKFVNTDYMHQIYGDATLSPARNVPYLDGKQMSPNYHYYTAVIEGFSQMYRFLREKRQSLLSEPEALKLLEAQKIRFVWRPTKVYDLLLQKTLTPECLKNGIERSIGLDILARTFIRADSEPGQWQVLHSELNALEQLDIPYFGAWANSDALCIGAEHLIKEFFVSASYSQVRERLSNMDEADLTRQVAIIQTVLQARHLPQPINEPAAEHKA